MYISAQTNHRDACWQWLSFLSRSQLQINKNAFPARRSVAESAAFVQQASPDAQALYAAYLPQLQASSVATNPFADATFEPFWLYQAIDRALQGANLERELAQAQEKTTAYFQCMETKGTRRACATKADHEYQGLAPQE